MPHPKEERKTIKAIDIELDQVESSGVAYYRLNKGTKDFLEKCLEEHDIVGFEWTPGEWNFGVILKDK